MEASLYQCIDGFDVCLCDIVHICTLFTIMLVKSVQSGRVQSTIMQYNLIKDYERQVFW